MHARFCKQEVAGSIPAGSMGEGWPTLLAGSGALAVAVADRGGLVLGPAAVLPRAAAMPFCLVLIRLA
jgi:hypothetical protein